MIVVFIFILWVEGVWSFFEFLWGYEILVNVYYVIGGDWEWVLFLLGVCDGLLEYVSLFDFGCFY